MLHEIPHFCGPEVCLQTEARIGSITSLAHTGPEFRF